MTATAIDADQLWEVVDSIWSEMLGLTVSAAGDAAVVQDSAKLTTGIFISGAFRGLVLFLPTEQFARRAAARMLAVPEHALESADVEDAVCELCNMLGGGVKSLLPGPSTLSLPSVMRGSQYSLRVPGAQLAAHSRFQCEGQPLEVRVLCASPEQ